MFRAAIFATMSSFFIFAKSAHAQHKKPQDYPPYNFSSEYSITSNYKDIRFDHHEFKIAEDKTVRVEGRHISIQYGWRGSNDPMSPLEFHRTISEYAKRGAGEIIYQVPEDNACFGGDDDVAQTTRFNHKGTPVWVSIVCSGGDPAASQIQMEIIEEKEFHFVENTSADEIKTAIDTRGKAILHINFDFDRAELRPDAEPTMQQVLTVLKEEPELKLEVDGHTDIVGSSDYNQTLSKQRAAAVVARLVAAGVETSRLTSTGFGASRPIADSTTEQGRAENRRVELIKH